MERRQLASALTVLRGTGQLAPAQTTDWTHANDELMRNSNLGCLATQIYRGAIDVVSVKDWLAVEPQGISTFARTSVPAVT